MCNESWGSFFLHMAIHLIQYHLFKRLSFPCWNCIGTFVLNQLTIYVWVYFWTFLFLWSIHLQNFVLSPVFSDHSLYQNCLRLGYLCGRNAGYTGEEQIDLRKLQLMFQFLGWVADSLVFVLSGNSIYSRKVFWVYLTMFFKDKKAKNKLFILHNILCYHNYKIMKMHYCI